MVLGMTVSKVRSWGAMYKAVEQLVLLRRQDLGGDWGDAQFSDGVPPSVCATDHGGYGKTWGTPGVGVSIDRGGDGIFGATPQ